MMNETKQTKENIMTKETTKQSRIEAVIAKHGMKDYTIKQLANYANVSTKTFRVRVQKMRRSGVVNYYNSRIPQDRQVLIVRHAA